MSFYNTIWFNFNSGSCGGTGQAFTLSHTLLKEHNRAEDGNPERLK